jgi:elongator complex protein 1
MTLAWFLLSTKVCNIMVIVTIYSHILGNLLITPFRLQNVPPPSAAHTLQLSEQATPPIHLAISSSGERLVSLQRDLSARQANTLCLWQLNPRRIPGRGKILNPKLSSSHSASVSRPYQVLITECTDDDLLVSVLGYNSGGGGSVIIYRVTNSAWTEELSMACEANGRLMQSGDRDSILVWQSKEGGLFNGKCPMSCAMSIK